MRVRVGAAALLLLASCSYFSQEGSRQPTLGRSLSPSTNPSRPRTLPPPTFDTARAMEHIRHLANDVGNRSAGTEGETKAVEYIESVFRAAGYSVSRREFRRYNGTMSPNVIARSAEADYSKGYIVVGGHYDTVVGTVGANDNASGIAVVLTLAEALKGHPAAVEFIGFGAEEYPPSRAEHLVGSRAYATALIDPSIIRAMLSIDMVGAGPSVLIVTGRGGPAALSGEIADDAEPLGIPYQVTTEGSFSDHVAFTERGIPAAWLWAGNHPTLHKPSDVFSVVMTEEVDRTGRVALEWLYRRVSG